MMRKGRWGFIHIVRAIGGGWTNYLHQRSESNVAVVGLGSCVVYVLCVRQLIFSTTTFELIVNVVYNRAYDSHKLS